MPHETQKRSNLGSFKARPGEVAIEPKNGRRPAVTCPQDLWKKFQTVALEEEVRGGRGRKRRKGRRRTFYFQCYGGMAITSHKNTDRQTGTSTHTNTHAHKLFSTSHDNLDVSVVGGAL
jgi:hypothetical protein